jgi:hypothetical protein
MIKLAQSHAEVRKELGLKIVGKAADAILQVLFLCVPLRPSARCVSTGKIWAWGGAAV